MTYHHPRRWKVLGQRREGWLFIFKASLLLVLQFHFKILLDVTWNRKSQVHHSHPSLILITAWAAFATLNHLFYSISLMCSGHALLAFLTRRREKAVCTIISFTSVIHLSFFETGFVFLLSEEERKKKTTIEEVHDRKKWNVTNN